jgi:hypothetical protein
MTNGLIIRFEGLVRPPMNLHLSSIEVVQYFDHPVTDPHSSPDGGLIRRIQASARSIIAQAEPFSQFGGQKWVFDISSRITLIAMTHPMDSC